MEIASPFDDFTYVIDGDKDKPVEKQRRLVGRYPTIREKAIIDDMRSQRGPDGGACLNTGSTNLIAMHMCLKKMENFFDKNGTQIVLERDESQVAALPNNVKPWNEIAFEYIPEIDYLRCAAKIKNGGDLDEAELKN